MTDSTPTPAGGESSPRSSATEAVKGAASQAAGAAAQAAGAAQAAVGQVTGKAGEAAQQLKLSGGVDATVARIRELNERAITAAKAAGVSALDAYEKALQSVVEVEEKLGTASSLDWIQQVINAQADFMKKISANYVAAIRERLK